MCISDCRFAYPFGVFVRMTMTFDAERIACFGAALYNVYGRGDVIHLRGRQSCGQEDGLKGHQSWLRMLASHFPVLVNGVL